MIKNTILSDLYIIDDPWDSNRVLKIFRFWVRLLQRTSIDNLELVKQKCMSNILKVDIDYVKTISVEEYNEYNTRLGRILSKNNFYETYMFDL